MSRTIFIGDVHGCLEELLALLGAVKLRDNDRLVFLGDLIHKGPDSEGVLDLVSDLARHWDVELITGNHEEKHERWLRAEHARVQHGVPNTIQYVQEYPLINIKNRDRELIRTSFVARRFPEMDLTCVHAGIPTRLQVLNDTTYTQWLALPPQEKKALGEVMRTRFLAGPGKTSTNSKGRTRQVPEGEMLKLGTQEPGDPYWADIYDGRFGKVIFGHNPFTGEYPRCFPHAIGIDLGCVHGGYLAAAICEKPHELKFVTVKAYKEYAPHPSWIYDK